MVVSFKRISLAFKVFTNSRTQISTRLLLLQLRKAKSTQSGRHSWQHKQIHVSKFTCRNWLIGVLNLAHDDLCVHILLEGIGKRLRASLRTFLPLPNASLQSTAKKKKKRKKELCNEEMKEGKQWYKRKEEWMLAEHRLLRQTSKLSPEEIADMREDFNDKPLQCYIPYIISQKLAWLLKKEAKMGIRQECW